MPKPSSSELRRGWTTGACATAASKAAFTALLDGSFPDPVAITLPRGQTPSFSLAREEIGEGFACAAVIKDAGDDPDVTHHALIESRIEFGPPGRGVRFRAGPGVGMVTKAGLPLAVGEPAINPIPRKMIETHLREVARIHSVAADLLVTVSVPGGEELALKTWNPRLGIRGGISILGTTGIVVPYSCSAWIHSIHRGIDVARANGFIHAAGCTGSTSETFVQEHHSLPEEAMLDMGDFAGGLLKYLRKHPLPRLTLGGGFGKFSKMAQGHLDLHSGRSQVDFEWLGEQMKLLNVPGETVEKVCKANTAAEVLEMAEAQGVELADHIASKARKQALKVLQEAPVSVEVMIISHQGSLVGHAPFV